MLFKFWLYRRTRQWPGQPDILSDLFEGRSPRYVRVHLFITAGTVNISKVSLVDKRDILEHDANSCKMDEK